MHTYFNDNFSAHADGEFPDGWLVEQHADLFHKLGEVRSGGYWIMFPGNRHLPLMPRLRNFTLTLRLRAESYSAAMGLLVFFRYDRECRAGYCLRFDWKVTGIESALGIYRDGKYTTLAKAAAAEPVFPTGAPAGKFCAECTLRLAVHDREFQLWHDERRVAQFTEAQLVFDQPGLLAFDRPGFAGTRAITLLTVRVESDESVPETDLWPERPFEFPPQLNGMNTPFYYGVRAVRAGGRVLLYAALTGGPREGRSPIHVIQARLDGQQAGLVTALEHLDRLAPEDAHTLVLPPLYGVAPEELAAIRRLHKQGVALLGFENVSGLEDLFGVEPSPKAEIVKEIQVSDVRDNPLMNLPAQREKCENDACLAHYRLAGGIAWLEDNGVSGRKIPVLVAHRTNWGRTALFTIPPTLVRRSDLKCLVAYGKESISTLINGATALALREFA